MACGTLGACQPVAGGAFGCAALCARTVACVGWTHVRPGASDWERRCGEDYARLTRLAANYTVWGRCCLEDQLRRGAPATDACCESGEVASPCRTGCRMPWSPVQHLDDLSAAQLDKQRASAHACSGGCSLEQWPWVVLQQQTEKRLRSSQRSAAAGSPPPTGPPRVAICLTGAVRSMVHPAVGRAFCKHVLGVGGAAQLDVFAVLGTGGEDHRARTNSLPLDEQEYLRSAGTCLPPKLSPRRPNHASTPTDSCIWPVGSVVPVFASCPHRPETTRLCCAPDGARLLAHALNVLQPVAVEIDTGSNANASCGVAPTAQFARLARCVALAKAHEKARGFKYDLLVRTRPDVLWGGPLLSHGVRLDELARWMVCVCV